MARLDTEIDVEDELERYDRLLVAVNEDLQEQGLSMPRKPSSMPEWPEIDITKVKAKELFSLHGRFQEYFRYIATQEAHSRATLKVVKEKVALVKAAVRRKAKGTNKEQRDDGTTLDGLFQSVKQEETYWATLHTMHESLRDIFDKDVKAISRQIVRLEGDMDNTRRGVNLTNSPRWRK